MLTQESVAQREWAARAVPRPSLCPVSRQEFPWAVGAPARGPVPTHSWELPPKYSHNGTASMLQLLILWFTVFYSFPSRLYPLRHLVLTTLRVSRCAGSHSTDVDTEAQRAEATYLVMPRAVMLLKLSFLEEAPGFPDSPKAPPRPGPDLISHGSPLTLGTVLLLQTQSSSFLLLAPTGLVPHPRAFAHALPAPAWCALPHIHTRLSSCLFH